MELNEENQKGYTLVTGSAKNLGKEICLTLAKQKFNLLVHYHKSEQEAFEVVEACRSYGVKAQAIKGDFSSLEGIKIFSKACKEKFPEIKNLVNNVGNYLVKAPLETSIEEVQDLFCTNLYAPLYLIQTLVETIKQHQGSIINIGVAGIERGRAESYSTAYSLTKASLLMLTRSLAKSLSPFHVTVNMVSPGILEGAIDAPLDPSLLPTLLPMGRLGTLKEVAELIAFLLKQENHYITGQNIEVAGGVRL